MWQPDVSLEPGRRFWMITALVGWAGALLFAAAALGLTTVIATH
jgi:hypothetical protein